MEETVLPFPSSSYWQWALKAPRSWTFSRKPFPGDTVHSVSSNDALEDDWLQCVWVKVMRSWTRPRPLIESIKGNRLLLDSDESSSFVDYLIFCCNTQPPPYGFILTSSKQPPPTPTHPQQDPHPPLPTLMIWFVRLQWKTAPTQFTAD